MIKKIIFLFLVFVTTCILAQEGTFSPYSYYGIGNNTFRGTAENRSMGSISTFSDSIHLNLQNPAGYSQLKLTTFSIAATSNALKLQDEFISQNLNYSTVDYVVLGLPLKKFGVGFGFKPTSSVGYEIQTFEDEIEKVLSGRGGVNAIFLSGGLNLYKNLSFGATINYNFGELENKNIISQEGIERSTREINTSDLSGLTFELGLQHKFYLKKKQYIASSLMYSPESSLDLKGNRSLATILFGANGREVVIDSEEAITTDDKVDFGGKINAGIGVGKDNKWFVGVEYTYQEPSNFDAIVFNNNLDLNYVEANQFKLGGYFIPRYNAPTGFFNRVVYRAGFRYGSTGIDFRNESINEFGISFGLGIPAGRLFSNINLGGEYWSRGTTSNNLVQEDYFSVFISLSFNDLWFQKPKYN
jgi:hypothetical protein